MSDTMREAARLEASALYESEDTYNHPEEVIAKAFERGAAWQAAQSQPAPPVLSSVQEIMPLVNAYVRACGEFLISGEDGADEALKPLQAALTALVDDNHRLRFELDGVNATRPMPNMDAMQTIYAKAWSRAADWANRHDLHSDVGSPAYLKDMAIELAEFADVALDGVNAVRRPAMEEHAARWMWARKNLLSACFQSGKHNSGQTSITPIGEANTDWYWDRIADQFRGIEPEQGGNHG